MSRTQRTTTDILFVTGLISGFVWCGAQTLRAFTHTNGISLAQYFAFWASFVIGGSLAWEARKAKPGPVISQLVILFTVWGICSTFLIGVVITRGNYHWSSLDTLIAKCAAAGLVTTTIWAALSSKGLKDAPIRAWNGISLKALPQFLLVPKILSEGGEGITLIALVTGHISIICRTLPLILSIRTEGTERNKNWLIMEGLMNFLSWCAVTIAWSLYH